MGLGGSNAVGQLTLQHRGPWAPRVRPARLGRCSQENSYAIMWRDKDHGTDAYLWKTALNRADRGQKGRGGHQNHHAHRRSTSSTWGSGLSAQHELSHAVLTVTLREERLLLSSCRRKKSTKIVAVFFSGKKTLKNTTESS